MTSSTTKLSKEEMMRVTGVVKKYLSKNVSINNRTLRALTDIGYDQAIFFFNFMVKEKLLERVGQGSGTKYTLSKKRLRPVRMPKT